MKTNRKDFLMFKKEVRKWVKVLGLYDWEIYFLHKTLEEAVAGMGHVESAKNATFFLSKEWGDHEVTPQEISKAAFHEVLELLLCPVVDMIRDRYISEDLIAPTIHSIIHRIENVVKVV